MKKISEKFFDRNKETLETEKDKSSVIETDFDSEKIESEEIEKTDQRIKKLQRQIKEGEKNEAAKANTGEDLDEKIKRYQERHLPRYLKKNKGLISKFLTKLWIKMGGKLEAEGKENIPEKGPFIVIGNHFGGGDAEAIMETFGHNNLHFGVAKGIWWRFPLRWILKRLGMIPIEESLSNLSKEEKEDALREQGKRGKKIFRKIIEREKKGAKTKNADFVRQSVAALSRGESVGIYPEGLWLHPEGAGKLSRERKELKKGYRGIELIVREYKRLTGEELPIVPTAYIEDAEAGIRKIIVGKSLRLSENNTDLSGVDWCMAHVAEILPEQQRGYYKNISLRKKRD